MFGILNIDKPAGVTSRDVVSRIQGRIRPAKVGHAGTLDPLATGVLLIGVGAATRLVPYLQQSAKQYTATFELGQRSVSDDTESEVETVTGVTEPQLAEIEAAIPQFVGTIQQRPPAYSALKINGKRAYALARAGAEFKLEPRPIRVDGIAILHYAYPSLMLRIECGAGTYIRSLGRDLAMALGTFAVMSALRRDAIGNFRAVDAWSMPADSPIDRSKILDHLQPAALAVEALPKTMLTANESQALLNGREIRRDKHLWVGEIAAVDSTGQLVAILAPSGADSVRPIRNFARA